MRAKRGLYISKADAARSRIVDLLVEAAMLIRQGTNDADALAMLNASLAILRMAEIDEKGTTKEIAERYLRWRMREE